MTLSEQLTNREQQLAEDMTSVLDMLSRLINGLADRNVHYATEKAGALQEWVARLERHLAEAQSVRPQFLHTGIALGAQHYSAGRALYPLQAGAR